MADQLAIAAAAPDPLTDEQRAAFLAYIEERGATCSVREACEVVGIKRKQIRHLKRTDPEFAEDYREARGYSDERIRAAIAERAIDGVEEVVGVTKEGEPIMRRVYSDRLLALMAKAHLPEYRDRVEHTGPDGGPLEVTNPDVAAAIERFGATVRRLTERAQSSGAVRAPEPAPAELPSGEPGEGRWVQR